MHTVPYTLEALRNLFENKLQMKICLNSPYKLCDYRPMYGLLFEDYLSGYDFWGHCDNDLIFGNIRKFLTNDILSKYDRILSRGHLSLYRNTDKVNRYFMKSELFSNIPSWKDIIKTDKNQIFDEWAGVSRMWGALDVERMYDEIIFDDISISKKHFLSYQKMFRQIDKGKSHFMFEYDKGELYRWYLDDEMQEIAKEPTLYVHLQKRDMLVKTDNTNQYLLVPNQFIQKKDLTKRDVLHWGKKHFFYMKYYKIRWKNLKRKLSV